MQILETPDTIWARPSTITETIVIKPNQDQKNGQLNEEEEKTSKQTNYKAANRYYKFLLVG